MLPYLQRSNLGGQDRIAIKRPHCNDKDVGSNPTATRKETWTLPQWSKRISVKTSDVKLN